MQKMFDSCPFLLLNRWCGTEIIGDLWKGEGCDGIHGWGGLMVVEKIVVLDGEDQRLW